MKNNMYKSSWYSSLQKSSLNPPDIVFKIVWPILYALIAASFILYLVKCNNNPRADVLSLFIVQIVLNVAWTYIFFVQKSMGWAVVDILALLGVSIAYAVRVYDTSALATYLWLPYLGWLVFALYLASYVYVNN